MSVKSWMATAMIVGILGLGVEIPTPTTPASCLLQLLIFTNHFSCHYTSDKAK